jgi:glycine hydroxymethyltransferase
VGAFLFADIAHPAGLIAKGRLDSPVPYCDVVTSTTHKTLRGPRAGMIIMGRDYENPFGQVAPKSGRVKMMSELVDSMVMPGVQGGPLMHVIAAKAIAFGEALTDDFDAYTKRVVANARALAAALSDYGFTIISGGTDNHLMLIDLRNKGITGKKAEESLDAAGITCNKNAVPFDDKPPLVTSGIRIGTAAVTTRGMDEDDMRVIADWINRIIVAPDDEKVQREVRHEIKTFCERFPLYPSIGSPINKAFDALEGGIESAVESVEKVVESLGDEIASVLSPRKD